MCLVSHSPNKNSNRVRKLQTDGNKGVALIVLYAARVQGHTEKVHVNRDPTFFVKVYVAQDGYVRTLVDTGRSWTPPFVDHVTHVYLKREKSV